MWMKAQKDLIIAIQRNRG